MSDPTSQEVGPMDDAGAESGTLGDCQASSVTAPSGARKQSTVGALVEGSTMPPGNGQSENHTIAPADAPGTVAGVQGTYTHLLYLFLFSQCLLINMSQLPPTPPVKAWSQKVRQRTLETQS